MWQKIKCWLGKDKAKTYIYKSWWGYEHPEYIRQQWGIIKPILERKGYRIEVEKIKTTSLFGSKIYYHYIGDDEK